MSFNSMPFLYNFRIGQLGSKIFLTLIKSGIKHIEIILWSVKLYHHVIYPEDGGSVFLYAIGTHYYVTQYHNREDQNINLHCCEKLKYYTYVCWVSGIKSLTLTTLKISHSYECPNSNQITI
jgi:hypothetical protein